MSQLVRGRRGHGSGLVAAIVIAICATVAAGAGLACKVARITASDSTPFDSFGIAVAVDDDALVGAYTDKAGSAYVFSLDGSNWAQAQKLVAPDGLGGDKFGQAVAIDGDIAMVGAPQHEHGAGYGVGAVYVFRREGSGWVKQQELLTSGPGASDLLGRSISLRGDVALIGAPADSDIAFFSGSAHVYRLDPQTSQWVHEQELHASDAAFGDSFGFSVALGPDGSTALVGSLGDNGSGFASGSAYVFRFEGSNWVEEQKLVPSDGAASDEFGRSVATSGDVALIGARGAAGSQGAAYSFRFDTITSKWVEEQKLTSSRPAGLEQFGYDVALEGGIALIGAWSSDAAGISDGAAYVFRHEGKGWVEHQVHLPDLNPWTSFFGWSVAMKGDLGLVGAYGEDFQRGAAYVFRGLGGADCNGSGQADSCDILQGVSDDANGNGIPDKCEQCPWDLDGSGAVGISDFLGLLAAWGGNPGGPPDFDGDGTVGIIDFLALLANWGTCP